MNFELIPLQKTMEVLKSEPDPEAAFQKILSFGNKSLPSSIWIHYEKMNLSTDIQEAQAWIQQSLDRHPQTSGIYLGLDTLNMNEGTGTNIEIGLSISCNPNELVDDWAYVCEHYGESHLIKGLFEVSHTFSNEQKWNREERSFAEYLIFLAYSGVVLREALFSIESDINFLSMWGFHDGDMFYLVQKMNEIKEVVAGKE